MTDSTNQSDALQESIDDNLVYVLIYEGSTGTDFSQLTDPTSVASQVARGRGAGELRDDIPDTDDSTSEDTEQQEEYSLSITEGKIGTKSGYVMRFVTEDHLDLNVFDVLSVPDLQSYPVPEDAYDTLPVHIRGYLEENGYVKIRGSYDHETSSFFGVQRGWEHEGSDVNAWDRLPELIRILGSEQAAIDYLLIEEGPKRWDTERIAEIRDVTERAIDENLRVARAELSE
ncbi:hypothetical protein [Salinibaculum rarum]|uniref:hypothetical protein n=1 Tax=Salinibaculum rarum TaxID=3058903 RepID=UPI00265F5566|nr:hypothetical protein [Salinibaculum sp. KK48]